jgi:hypothetical protein
MVDSRKFFTLVTYKTFDLRKIEKQNVRGIFFHENFTNTCKRSSRESEAMGMCFIFRESSSKIGHEESQKRKFLLQGNERKKVKKRFCMFGRKNTMEM